MPILPLHSVVSLYGFNGSISRYHYTYPHIMCELIGGGNLNQMKEFWKQDTMNFAYPKHPEHKE